MRKENIGLDVKIPDNRCDDNNCPFHGSLKVRGRKFDGTVVSSKMRKTVLVEWERKKHLRKYERYEKRRTKLKAHNPPCINTREGDIVTIMECRPLSKSKNFVVVQKLGSKKGYVEKMRLREEGKAKSTKPEESAEKETKDGKKEQQDSKQSQQSERQ